MNAIYKLSNGEKLSVFLWGDLINGDTFRNKTSARLIMKNGKISREHNIKIYKDNEDKLFFRWNDEVIYFDNFEYMTVDELVEKINNCKSDINPDEILATLIKDTDNVGIISSLDYVDSFVPSTNIGVCSGKKCEPILCVPTEGHHEYRKCDWEHKFRLEAEDTGLRHIYGYRDFYFLDFVSMVMDRQILIVNKNEYKKAMPHPTIECIDDLITINIPRLISLGRYCDDYKNISQYFSAHDIDKNNYTVSPQTKYILNLNNIVISINVFANKIIIDRKVNENNQTFESNIEYDVGKLYYSEFIHDSNGSTQSVKMLNSPMKNPDYNLTFEYTIERIKSILEEIKNTKLYNETIKNNVYVKNLSNI